MSSRPSAVIRVVLAASEAAGWTRKLCPDYRVDRYTFTRPGEELVVLADAETRTIDRIVGTLVTGPVTTKQVDVRRPIDENLAVPLFTGRARADYPPTAIVFVVGEGFVLHRDSPNTFNRPVSDVVALEPGVYPVQIVDDDSDLPARAVTDIPGTITEETVVERGYKRHETVTRRKSDKTTRAMDPRLAVDVLAELKDELPPDLTGAAVYLRRADLPADRISLAAR